MLANFMPHALEETNYLLIQANTIKKSMIYLQFLNKFRLLEIFQEFYRNLWLFGKLWQLPVSNRVFYIGFFINIRGGLDSQCSNGYMGPLCSVCIYNENMKNYKISDNICVECQSLAVNIIIIIVFVLMVGTVLIFIMRYWIFLNKNH